LIRRSALLRMAAAASVSCRARSFTCRTHRSARRHTSQHYRSPQRQACHMPPGPHSPHEAAHVCMV
jgi:hypothetical protein